MRRYLSATAPEDRVDVLMCEYDILAMGAMDAIRSEFHLRVPTDIPVVGFDNLDLCGVPAYGLRTCQQPIREMVTAVVEIVLGRREPQTVRLPSKLVVRQTS
jgi:LacI family transcriptional regulator